ncbi:Peroxisomal acyl-coenzyme a oxidase, partial [Globisporangium splendens]
MEGGIELKDLAPLLLKKERQNGDIDVEILTNILRDSKERNARRKEMEAIVAAHPVLRDRDMMYRNHHENYNFGVKKAHHYIKLIVENNFHDLQDQQSLYGAMGGPMALDPHRIMFIPALENQADDEQQKKWLPLAKNYKIFGSYAQTELGHGSNVQALETTAHFDKETQEFIINSPTLTSRKWWPGGLGKTSTHAIVYARLFLDGKSVGLQAFIVQLRSLETHEPLPGIELGDIGPKVGFNSVDNGYAAFHNVRIPRENMLMRFAKVLPDGTFVKAKSDRLLYLGMVQIRAYLVTTMSFCLASATTITTRFSAARVQGRKPQGNGEFQVLDYQNQQHALFPLIGLSYAANFSGRTMIDMYHSALDSIKSDDPMFAMKLAELHAVSSGLKAYTADAVCNGIETCRRMCGGHGFTQSSNLNHIFNEIVGACTFEGTFDVLVQQHARYLLKALSMIQANPEAAAAMLGSSDKESNTVGFLVRFAELTDPRRRCSAAEPEHFGGDFSLLLEAFQVRATRNLFRLAKEMRATGNDVNACMVLMAQASVAHSELLLVSAFANGVEDIPAGPTRDAMANLCILYSTSLIVKSMGDFRNAEYLSSSQSDLVRQQVVRLLPIVRKNAVLATDAWDISDFDLNSVIGRYDGDIYRALVKRAADEPLNKTQVAESYEKYLKPLIQSNL